MLNLLYRLFVGYIQGMDTTTERDSDVRPACRFCGKTFAQASYIKAHERLHTGTFISCLY